MGYIGKDPIPTFKGGTGVKNLITSTLTLGGPLTLSGAFPAVFNITGSTNVTFPTSGTLATTAGTAETFVTDSGSAVPSAGNITFNAASQAGSTVSFSGSGSTISLNTTDANFNVVIGKLAGSSGPISGSRNTSEGYNSFRLLTSGIDNTGVGFSALDQITSGSYNISLGYSSGNPYTSTESSNIAIGYQIGVVGDNNTTRIGNQGSGNGQQNLCYIAGISGATATAGSPTFGGVAIDTSTGQLVSSTTGISNSGWVWTSTGISTPPTWQAASGGGGITTINTDNGSVTGSSINLLSGPTNPFGSNGTILFQTTGTTIGLTTTDGSSNLIFGASSAGSITSAANNTFVGVNVANNVTSGSSNTGIGLQCGQTLTTGSYNFLAGQQVFASHPNTGSYNSIIGSTNNGSPVASGSTYTTSESSNILINNVGVVGDNHAIRIGTQGSGAGQQNSCYIAGINNTNSSGFTSPLAVFVDSSTGQLGFGSSGGGGITKINGNSSDTGSSTTPTITTGASNANGTSVFTGNGSSTLTLSYTNATTLNTGIGTNALKLNTAASGESSAFGYGALASSVSTVNCDAFGVNALNQYTGVGFQVIFGGGGFSALTGDNTGTGENVGIGYAVGNNLINGEFNTLLGWNTGGNYSGAESSNICIGYRTQGTASENNVLRIGNGTGSGNGNLAKAFICGIAGVTVTSTAAVLVNTSTNQLGTVISSRRFKDNIQDMSDASEVIYKLRPVQYTLKEHPEYGRQTGLIAEEVLEVAPQLVALDKEGFPASVSYHELPALLLNELQKLRKEFDAYKALHG